MNEKTEHPETSHSEKSAKGAGPLLFYVMLGVIVVSVVIFLLLSPIHIGNGSASKTRAAPMSQ